VEKKFEYFFTVNLLFYHGFRSFFLIVVEGIISEGLIYMPNDFVVTCYVENLKEG